MYFVYIVRGSDDSLYTGYTRNVERRVWEHNNLKRGAKSLKGKLPVELVYIERFRTRTKAMRREHEIKAWKREKKLNLIAQLKENVKI